MTLFPSPLSVEYREGQVDLSIAFQLISPPFSTLRPSSVEGLTLSEAGIPIRFHHADLPQEGYAVTLAPQGIDVSSSEERGALNALRTLSSLAQEGHVRAQRITDAPGLAMRVFHLDLKDQMLSFDYILRLVDRLAALRYNALLVEYEDKFPYSTDIIPAHPERLTPDEVSTLIEHSRERGIEVIPCVPTLGHLEFVLYHRPDLAETDARYQVCPLKAEALTLVKRMVDEVLSLHPSSRFFHVGGDETWYLGRCPECQQVAAREGVASLYGRFMREVLAHVLEQGRRPWIWADMVLAHPDALSYMPRDVIFVDWEYSYYGEEVDYVRNWGGGGIVPAERWEDFPPKFRARYEAYVRPEAASPWVKGFSYTRYLREAGYEVLTGSSVRSYGDPYTHPNWKVHLPNVVAAARVASEAKALGSVVTSWAIRRVLPELTMLGVTAGAGAMWRPEAADEAWLMSFPGQYGELFLGDSLLGWVAWELSSPGLGYDQAVPRERSSDGRYFRNRPWEERVQGSLGGYPNLSDKAVRELSRRIQVAYRALSVLERALEQGNDREEVRLYRLAAEEALLGAWAIRVGARWAQQPEDVTIRKVAQALREQLEALRSRCAREWASYLHPAALEREIRERFEDFERPLVE